jgi:hypothetical protein
MRIYIVALQELDLSYLIKIGFLKRLLFSFIHQRHHFLKVQYYLPFRHLRILTSLITSSIAYREAFRKESFLVV